MPRMTKVIYISGPSGSGKTTLARALVNRIEHSVMLDVDALWEQGDKEWVFDKSMKHLALTNFETCLENCMRCDSVDVVIACGVLRGSLGKDLVKAVRRIAPDIHFIQIEADAETLEAQIAKRLNLRGVQADAGKLAIESLANQVTTKGLVIEVGLPIETACKVVSEYCLVPLISCRAQH